MGVCVCVTVWNTRDDVSDEMRTCLVFISVCQREWDEEEYCICPSHILHMLCMYSTLTENFTFPMCAYRSCTTSKAWKCRETWRGSWSRSCSQTQNTLLCWQAGATLLEVCSSRCPSALPLTWSRPSPAHIRLRVTRWPLNCQTSRRAHVSGQCWDMLNHLIFNS